MTRFITIPGPEGATRVRFEDRNGVAMTARLITSGSYKGLWGDEGGGIWDWPDLLVAHEPLEVVE